MLCGRLPNEDRSMSTIEKLLRVRAVSDHAGGIGPVRPRALAVHARRRRRPASAPVSAPELMDDMWRYLHVDHAARGPAPIPAGMRHVVLASDATAFNLGGDLELFSRLIRDNNRERLLAYARLCVDGVHHLHNGLGGDVARIALVQGDALGGGFELALCLPHHRRRGRRRAWACRKCCSTCSRAWAPIRSCASACRPQQAEKMMLERRHLFGRGTATAWAWSTCWCPKGEGERAVQDLIRQQQRAPHAHLRAERRRAIAQPVSHDELMGITEVWVDTALALGDRSLKTMERIVRAQERRRDSQPAAGARIDCWT